MSFWDVVWFIFITFMFVAYLMVIFMIISDLFRDRETSGLMKAVWIIALILFPVITSLIYLVVRGRHMAERSARSAAEARHVQDEYIRDVASSTATPADEIAQAKAMLDSGVISQPEYERLKEKALR